jgi:hypothetical protein
VSGVPTSIPLGDLAAFDRRARAVRRVRIVTAVLVALLTLAFLLVSLRESSAPPSLLPASSTGIVVLDVSASISSDTYARIDATLQRLIRSKGSYGLILFSDTAYQALPPNTPARELRPLERFFAIKGQSSPGALPEAPRSPWSESFGGGTRISTGLSLALDEIRARKLVNPAVLLVSDLDDDSGDVDRVSQVAIAYRRAGIPLHVVGLNADPQDAAFMRRFVAGNGSFTPATLPSESSGSATGGANRTLVALAVLVAAGIALFLLVSEPLRWRPR